MNQIKLSIICTKGFEYKIAIEDIHIIPDKNGNSIIFCEDHGFINTRATPEQILSCMD